MSSTARPWRGSPAACSVGSLSPRPHHAPAAGNAPALTTGLAVAGRWLFKQEDPALWSLGDGKLTLKTNCTGLETGSSANMMVQRPTSAYYSIETALSWVGPCGAADTASDGVVGGTAGGAQCGHDIAHGVDYMGHDILPDAQRLFLRSADACCAACANHSLCSFWSFSTNDTATGCVPGVTGNCGRCYLKTSNENHQAQKGFVSGSVGAGSGSGSAGIVAREFNSGSSAAIGVLCDAAAGGLRLALWQDTANLLWLSPTTLPVAGTTVHLKLDVDLVRAIAWFRLNDTAPWTSFSGDGTASERYTATRLVWELVHVGPGKDQWPSDGMPDGGGGEGGAASTANMFKQADSFTTFHPGLFAGGGSHAGNAARFEFWRYTDNEVFAE